MNIARLFLGRAWGSLAGLLIIAAVLATGACSSFGGSAEGAAFAAAPFVDSDDREFSPAAERFEPPSEASSPLLATEQPAPISLAATSIESPLDAQSGSAPEGQDAEEPERVERLRIYSADLDLVVPSVAESRDEIIVIVETAGGYVESSREDYLVVRVPAELFDPVLQAIEDTGEVRSSAVRTSDVTDQFFDLERRLRISEASRERLLQLLEQTEDSDGRVAILRDIRRLTEEIEQLRASLESLDQLIRFSRITIQLISLIQVSQVARREIPFPWIAALSPLEFTTQAPRSSIPITPDESFAVFDAGLSLFAEAADGTQFRAGVVTNEPSGDEEFWQSALHFHLGPFYHSTERLEAGEYRGVLLESKDTDPFYYLVLVHRRDDELIVAEAFIPTLQAKESRLEDILLAIVGDPE